MKITFRERGWFENMGLVFLVCRKLFLPLFVASLLIGIPAFAVHYESWTHFEDWFWPPPGYRSIWAFILDLLEISIRQGVCLYLVARCHEGIDTGIRTGWRRVLSCLPSLFVVNLISFFAIGLSLVPASGIMLFAGVLADDSANLEAHGMGVAWILGFAVLLIICGSFPVGWILSGLALGPPVTVLLHRDPLFAVGKSLELAGGHRWYLLSFLGILYLPPLFVTALAPIRGDGPNVLLNLVGLELLQTLVHLPATIAPAILYFHFTAKARQLPAANLARLVDQVGRRHGGS